MKLNGYCQVMYWLFGMFMENHPKHRKYNNCIDGADAFAVAISIEEIPCVNNNNIVK